MDGLARERLCRFFSLSSARKSKYIRSQHNILELHFRDPLVVVVVLVVAKVHKQLLQVMRSSDPRVIIVFVTDSILTSTSDFLCRQLVVTSNADPILVFLRIEPFPFR